MSFKETLLRVLLPEIPVQAREIAQRGVRVISKEPAVREIRILRSAARPFKRRHSKKSDVDLAVICDRDPEAWSCFEEQTPERSVLIGRVKGVEPRVRLYIVTPHDLGVMAFIGGWPLNERSQATGRLEIVRGFHKKINQGRLVYQRPDNT